jgi:predicted transcriptional regulator
MSEVSVINKSSSKVGLIVRTQTKGPELDLLNSFIEQYVKAYVSRSLKSDIAIYVEPKIDSGYPDLVIAQYNKSFMNNWTPNRSSLTDNDLRILSYLLKTTEASVEDIVATLGFSQRETSKSIEVLSDCRIVIKKANSYRAAKTTSFFGIKKLTAVETKIGSSKEALTQAMQNTRFASHSYALLDSSNPNRNTVKEYEKFGVGILAGEKFSEIIKPVKRDLPTSYVALKFNEWIGRQLLAGEIK